MNELVLTVLTCLNVNSGWWCGNPQSKVYVTGNVAVTYQTVDYREMHEPDLRKITKVLYEGRKTWEERVAPYPIKSGCLAIVSNVREQFYISTLTCEQLVRKVREQIRKVK